MCGFLRWMKRKKKAFHSKQVNENREYSAGSQKIKHNKSCRETPSRRHAPSCLVFSISSLPQRSHCWCDSRGHSGMNSFSASLQLRLNLPAVLTELLSVPFHGTHFCKKTQRTCVVRGPWATWTAFPKRELVFASRSPSLYQRGLSWLNI